MHIKTIVNIHCRSTFIVRSIMAVSHGGKSILMLYTDQELQVSKCFTITFFVWFIN